MSLWDRKPSLDDVLTQLRGMHFQDAKLGDGTIPQPIIETIVAIEVFNGDKLKPWLDEVKTELNKLEAIKIWKTKLLEEFLELHSGKETVDWFVKRTTDLQKILGVSPI